MNRKLFFSEERVLNHDNICAKVPAKMYPQETDWTCSIACIRTMLSGILNEVPSEEEFITQYNLKPGPHYSKDIKQLGILQAYDVLYGCDNHDVSFDDILDYVESGYSVMLECMYNYAHWFVLLGYYPIVGENIEKSKILVYDPYYNEVRLLNADEFITMWIDGNYEHSRIEKDFIAFK